MCNTARTVQPLYFNSIGVSTVLLGPEAESGVNQNVKHQVISCKIKFKLSYLTETQVFTFSSLW
jgi:hypothetical protein